MIEKIVLLLAALFAVYWVFRTKKTLPAIITLGMVTGVVLVLYMTSFFHRLGFGIYVYMFFVLLAFLYSFFAKGKTTLERIIIALLSFSIIIYWLWVTNHWHGNEILAPVLALLVAILAVFTKANLRSELGFVLILVVDAILIIFAAWMKAC